MESIRRKNVPISVSRFFSSNKHFWGEILKKESTA